VAGLTAALTARSAGASVVVAESEDVVGGSSRLAGASLLGAGTRLQRRLGIDDGPDRFYHYYMTLNQWKPEPALVRRLANDCASLVDWLDDLGVRFEDHVQLAGEEDVPRKHLPVDAGSEVIAVLERQARDAGVDIALRRRVDRLLVEAGRVAGVAVGDDELRTHAVVIATGGFGANRDLIDRYFPDASQAGDWLWYIGASGARGDAFRFAEQVGAQVVGYNKGLLNLTPDFGPLLEGGYFPGWLVMVNGEGRRFFDETSSYSVTQPVVRVQPPPVFAIFDQAAKAAASPATADLVKRPKSPQRSFYFNKWVEPVLDEMIDKGVVVEANSLDALARSIGLDPKTVRGTMDRYNADVAAGRDSMFLKDPDLMRAVDTPPFYATELRLAHLAVTATGFRIDGDARVLDQYCAPIPGLYAAGECTGGVIGDVYVGSGNSYASCLVFGRAAGLAAARAIE
jgi:fumarate reductase flavoprotein subunit